MDHLLIRSLLPHPLQGQDEGQGEQRAGQDAQHQQADVCRREVFQDEQRGVVQQRADQCVLQERGDTHRLDCRHEVAREVAWSKEPHDARTEEGQQHGTRGVHARRVREEVYGQSQKEGPQHQPVARRLGVQLQDHVDIEEGRGIADDVHVVQDQHLQQEQSYEPS